MGFIYAKDLKKRFVCYGHFYRLLLMNGRRFKCRSVLEIVDHEISPEDPSEISLMKPDAVAIMMNPGSSHPKDGFHIDEEIEYPRRCKSFRKKLALARPDNTQYQLMRIGVIKNWHHIRVLNLSDFRDPRSGSFLQRVEACREIINGQTHSIFCDERQDEYCHAMNRKPGAPVLLGWGQDSGLIPLARQCLKRIAGEKTVSVPSFAAPDNPLLNAHPSPMLQKKKIQWLENMLHALEN